MRIAEEGRQLIQNSRALNILVIEERVTAVERRLELIEGGESKTEFSFEERIDGNHKKLMEALHGMEDRMWTQILERLARVESKLQSVA